MDESKEISPQSALPAAAPLNPAAEEFVPSRLRDQGAALSAAAPLNPAAEEFVPSRLGGRGAALSADAPEFVPSWEAQLPPAAEATSGQEEAAAVPSGHEEAFGVYLAQWWPQYGGGEQWGPQYGGSGQWRPQYGCSGMQWWPQYSGGGQWGPQYGSGGMQWGPQYGGGMQWWPQYGGSGMQWWPQYGGGMQWWPQYGGGGQWGPQYGSEYRPQNSGSRGHNYQHKGRKRWVKRRPTNKDRKTQREDLIRKTVYVSKIDHNVTEQMLAAFFAQYGPVVDCRICGYPNSAFRFAFVEFTDENDAKNALNLNGSILGFHHVRVLPSKTAIIPVNPSFLPQTDEERERCLRTVYVSNIDKRVSQLTLKGFFEAYYGQVSGMRLIGNRTRPTRIAFVEFVQGQSAARALNYSCIFLMDRPIRINPSKTPIRPRSYEPPA